MRTKITERLKDIIIDHIYSHCYDEIARTIEGEKAEEKYPGDDPDLQKIYDTFIKTFRRDKNIPRCKESNPLPGNCR